MLANAVPWIGYPGTVVACATIIAGTWRISRRVGRLLDKIDTIDTKVNTNHGKTIGEHVEDAALDASEAKTEARRVRIELAAYKVDRLDSDQEVAAAIREDAKATKQVSEALDKHIEQDAEVQGEILKRLPPAP